MKNLQIIMVKDCNHMFVRFPGSMKYTHETFFFIKKSVLKNDKKWLAFFELQDITMDTTFC